MHFRAPSLTKYLNIVGLSVQSALVYRVNFFVRATVNLIPLLATVTLWKAVYAGGHESIGGYTLEGMISYYIVVTIVEALTAVTEEDWQIANDIKDGQISQFLVKPIDYIGYRLCLFFSGRLIYTAAAALPVIGFLLLHRSYLAPPADGVAFVAFIVSVGLSALLQFLLCYLVAMLAFWVLEISTFTFILLAFERLASGQMFPLEVLPPAWERVLKCLPFAYESYFPVSVYLGRIAGAALVEGLAIQMTWVLVLYYLARRVWALGLRSYSAVGG